MNRPFLRAAALAGGLAAICSLAACGSGSGGGSPSAPTLPPTSGSSSAPSTSGGGQTMSPPHIVCQHVPARRTYDGTDTHPVELCLQSGADVHLTIKPPAGQTWALPTITPSGILSGYHAERSGRDLTVTATAARKGTATLAVPRTGWHLEIAVIPRRCPAPRQC